MSDNDVMREESRIASDRGPYRKEVRPEVDRDALLDAVSYPYAHQWLLMQKDSAIAPERSARLETLFKIRAAHRELTAWAEELGGSLADGNDPRSRRVTKAELFFAAKNRKPKASDNVSRWYSDNVQSTCDPDPHSPNSRTKLTVNLALFADAFGDAAAKRLKP